MLMREDQEHLAAVIAIDPIFTNVHKTNDDGRNTRAVFRRLFKG